TFTVSHSDNNGCDILFRLIGGTGKVEKYIQSLGIKDISISTTEEEMHKDWDTQFTNWSTPYAMGLLLMKFFKGEILSKNSQEYLWEKMVNTTTGANRIIALLPEGTIVAHKTGSSSTNDDGVTAATNDAGIVKLSDGNYFAIVVFVSDSKSNVKAREGIIAQISKAVWDYYNE
ncbi:MAG: TLA family class A extended-spectrum beta-lactamase, partial [Ignavibacteriales bacterium]